MATPILTASQCMNTLHWFLVIFFFHSPKLCVFVMSSDASHSSPTTKDLHNCLAKTERLIGLGSTGFLWFYFVFLSLMFSFYIFSSSTPFNFFETPANGYLRWKQSNNEMCDLFDGRWVPDKDGPLYSNFSCATIPFSVNCLFHGRENRDFLYWRWKPERCQLPRFDSKAFLSIVQGKTMAFIGDSLARNQMESLLCLLSMEEAPRNVYKDAEDKFKTWQFPHHNFTLMALRSNYLVHATERVVNGSFTGDFNLHLDKLDGNWTRNISTIDHAIISGANWFTKKNYLYEGGNLIGCTFCDDPNVRDFGARFAIRRAFEAAFKYINEERKGFVVFVRTISSSHFEHGTWKSGGFCNRTRGFSREEVDFGGDWDYRNVQVEEIERAKRYGESRGNKFEMIDVTRAMLMRPDGHPGGALWEKVGVKGYNDCLHWCMPGPIDTWNELLLQMLRKTST
nr:protein ALTERED XYLOGLUCAN 4-like [Ipomoea batatas]GME08922.1 protein ALTERED XYLOGLUCAN 4-like [Ipomoea batatas]